MKKQTGAKEKTGSPPSAYRQEDAALKLMMQFFADELLPLFGISEKVVSIAPIEQVDLTIRSFFEDFNLEMEDGTWKHFEFQSSSLTLEDLKRFRAYEAVCSYQYGVEVTTYVLCSGKVSHPMEELSEGINTYRVIPITMREKDAGEFVRSLLEKKECKEPISRAELVLLTLCPIMGGEVPQKERVRAAYQITKENPALSEADQKKIEAVIYAMADKFLESMDLDEIMEEMQMTRMGQKLVEKGRTEGLAEGHARGLAEGEAKGIAENTVKVVINMLLKDIEVSVIANIAEISIDEVLRIKQKFGI